jgi:hypothetical protein
MVRGIYGIHIRGGIIAFTHGELALGTPDFGLDRRSGCQFASSSARCAAEIEGRKPANAVMSADDVGSDR